MKVTLTAKDIRYPVDERPYAKRQFAQIPLGVSELIIKDVERQNGYVALSFITYTGDIYIHHQVYKDNKFKL